MTSRAKTPAGAKPSVLFSWRQGLPKYRVSVSAVAGLDVDKKAHCRESSIGKKMFLAALLEDEVGKKNMRL